MSDRGRIPRRRKPKALLVLALALVPATALAYVDPGSGYILWQLLVSMVVGVLYLFRPIAAFVVRLFRSVFGEGRKKKETQPESKQGKAA